jgi:hypothetical protein
MTENASAHHAIETITRYSAVLAELSIALDEAVEAGQEAVIQSALQALIETAGLAWGAMVVSQDGTVWVPCEAGRRPAETMPPDRAAGSRWDEALLAVINEGLRSFAPAAPSGLAVIPLEPLTAVVPAALIARMYEAKRARRAQS